MRERPPEGRQVVVGSSDRDTVLLPFTGQRGGRRLPRPSQAGRSGHVLRQGWRAPRLVASDVEFPQEHRGGLCASLPPSTHFFWAKTSRPTAEQKPALSDRTKKRKPTGKEANVFHIY